MNKILLCILNSFLLVLVLNFTANAQGVTTASIDGRVTDNAGEVLPGANVIAEHTPSGTTYGAVSNEEGRFFLPNLRVGGPYTVKVSFVGFEERTFENINLSLGQKYSINAQLSDGVELEGVEVIASQDVIMNSDRTGASTNLSNERINALPTIERSINDFTRLTPQSNGTSFAGTNNRFNNYTIDGNIYNNNFGLGQGQFAGSNPISLDAIEEIQVNLAPFDVRQGGFTGASVNAITRSGTNEFEGSAYYFLRNDQMIGNKAGDITLETGDSENKIYGFRLGGPVIKNKIFFFVNYEQETEAVPSFTKRALRDGETPNGLTISRVPASQLDFVREQLISLYGYDPGAYEGYSFASENERFNARLDFNLLDNHKFSVRYNLYTSFRDVPTNGNSIRFIQTRYNNTDRTGIEAMNFRNTNYTVDTRVQSIVAELNSIVGENMSNQLNIGYTSTTDPERNIPGGQAFPFIEVLEPDEAGNPLYYFSVGNELYSVGNLLENNVLNITDNFSLYRGKHTYTFGGNFEYMTFDNAFNPVFNGFYRFIGYENFVNAVIEQDGTFPDAFAKSYALDGSTTPPTDQTRFGQLGFYVQDEYQVTPQLKVTGGLRVDFPFYPIDIPRNELLDELNKTFTDSEGNAFTPDVSSFPDVNPLWSPRVGFNWDVKGDETTQVRGGTGVFSGRIPFVWLSNQVNGSGVVRGGLGYEGQDVIDNNITFNPDVTAYNPENPASTLSNELNVTDENFKLPQVWRSNLAVDQVLPFGIIGTLEFIYSRDVSTPIAYNPVLRAPDATLNGPDQRPIWTDNYSNDEDFSNVFLLTNAQEKADYYSLTAQLQKQFDNGFYAMVAYTRSRARDLDAAGGSQAISLWPRTVVSDRNDPELSFSTFDQPNRLIANLSYQTDNTTISLFYDGGEAGRFSYTYSGNFGDGSARLLYVPNDASELNFEEFTLGDEVITAAQQAALFDEYIDQDDYLSSKRGEVTERNGAVNPWVSRFDLRITEDIVLSENSRNRIQISLDFLNIGNLLNSKWGIPEFVFQSNPLNYRGVNENNEPIYRLNTISGTSDFPTETFRYSNELNNTWRLQLGLRYIFGN